MGALLPLQLRGNKVKELNNLTEDDKRFNTYLNHPFINAISIITCIFAAVFAGEEDGFFYSPYLWLMKRDIFIADDGFWFEMNQMLRLFYVVMAVALIVNLYPLVKQRRIGAYIDLFLLGLLALSQPIYFVVSVVGSRSQIKFLPKQLLIPVAITTIFIFVFVFFIKQYRKNKDLFIDMRTAINNGEDNFIFGAIAVAILVALCFPFSHLFKAVKMSAEYSKNYGEFKIEDVEPDPEAEETFGNKNNNGIVYEGNLYYNNGKNVMRVNADGSVNVIFTAPNKLSGFDIYDGKIYAAELSAEEAEYTLSFYAIDIATGENEIIYTQTDNSKSHYISLFKIKDGMLYYQYKGGEVEDWKTIFRADLRKDSFEKELYVSDVEVEREYLEYVFLDHYQYEELGYIVFSYMESVPYKGSLYYTAEYKELEDLDYRYKFCSKTYTGNAEQSFDDKEIRTDTGYLFNIYQDRVYIAEQNDPSSYTVYSMNLDGSDVQTVSKYDGGEDEWAYITAICVTDEFIMLDKGSMGIEVIPR